MTIADYIQRHRLPVAMTILMMAFLYASTVRGMVLQWYHDPNYSHGFLVPVIAAWFFWKRWDEVKNQTVVPDNLGLVVVLLAALQLVAASLAMENFTARSSLVVFMAGIVLFLFGRRFFLSAAPSLIYLAFMVPLPYVIYNSAAFPLKLFVTTVAVAVLDAVGIPVVREGNIIMLSTTTLEVVDACSGIRSLMALMAAGAAYAWLLPVSALKRAVIVLSTVPIAIATNATRVIVTGILAQYWGRKAAEGFFHEFAGMSVFVLGVALLIATGAVLNRRRR